MNVRLLLTKGLHPAHRVVFMTGVMAYLSAPLWFLFLVLSTVQLAMHTLIEPQYFLEPYQLFPRWPEWRPEWAIGLLAGTATLLFLPKLLSVFLVRPKRTSRYGGAVKLVLSVIGEILAASLLAPIRMLFHTRFVAMSLAGIQVRWKSPPREDAQTSWAQAIRVHGLHTAVGVAWAAGVYLLNPTFLWWLMPVAGALILSIPLSVYTSRTALGERFRRMGLFLIPEETQPPTEIEATQRYARQTPPPPGWAQGVVDSELNALMAGLAAARPALPAAARQQRALLVERALSEGPSALSSDDKLALLGDFTALAQLHERVRGSVDIHPDWLSVGVSPRPGSFSSSPG